MLLNYFVKFTDFYKISDTNMFFGKNFINNSLFRLIGKFCAKGKVISDLSIFPDNSANSIILINIIIIKAVFSYFGILFKNLAMLFYSRNYNNCNNTLISKFIIFNFKLNNYILY